jgi:pimeloyl-ACP methyl ester carboxylesterase
MNVRRVVPLVLACGLAGSAPALGIDRCLTRGSAAQDRIDIAAVRVAVESACPCAAATSHRSYVACAHNAVSSAVGTGLRRRCAGTVLGMERRSTCGSSGRVPCLHSRGPTLRQGGCTIVATARCTSGTVIQRRACPAATHCVDAGDSNGDGRIASPQDDLRCVTRATVDLASAAAPAHTPGSTGVTVTNPKLLAQFGGASFNLNNARYTRFRLQRPGLAPDAVLILVPGFEGGATDFKILAENLIPRLAALGVVLELWGFDRRTNQLEDRAGVLIAEQLGDPHVALDWLYGTELGLTLSPALATLNRRAVFYDTQADIPFIAQWTNLVFSQDIDAVVAAADAAVKNHNVFLGGHSAGTGFTARYASTDFNLTGVGTPDPGYAKLRGLVLLEGGGGSTGNALSADTLDRIVAKFDGGLFGAVRDNAPRCVDGTTPCTIANEANDCLGKTPPVCTEAAASYAVVPGILNPRILAVAEPGSIQARTDPNSQVIFQVDQGAPGNNTVAKVPDLATLAVIPKATPAGALGSFIDDDGIVAAVASFVATSVGAPGPVVGGLLTWLDIHQPQPPAVLPNNGPPPTALPAARWGQEKEVTDINRMPYNFVAGATNFTDWYYPSAGQSVTSVSGRCSGTSGTCLVGNVGAACSGATQAAADATCGNQAVNLDSTALSVGRGRRDIENLTQAANVSIPVIAFGGTNGLAVVPGVYTPFASSIGPCTAPSCNGTPRVVDPSVPNPAFPSFGGADGGFEVYMSEGFAHLDIVTAEDNPDNNVLAPLAAFLKRNVQ